MFKNEYGEAAVEVLDILDNTNKIDVAKIPSSFIKFLVDNASEDYKVNLDHSKPIDEMNIKEKTKEILGVIYIKWWCDKEEKENYMKQIRKLEMKRQKEKYNFNKRFEEGNNIQATSSASQEEKTPNETVAMVKCNDSFFKKILSKMSKFFSK